MYYTATSLIADRDHPSDWLLQMRSSRLVEVDHPGPFVRLAYAVGSP